MRDARVAAGRTAAFGLDVRPEPDDPDGWSTAAAAWSAAGASHLSVTVRSAPGMPTDAHIAQLESAREALASFFGDARAVA
jgi:hypothetical protein